MANRCQICGCTIARSARRTVTLLVQISGRNRVWRRMVIDAIRGDPAWHNGEYRTQPPSLRVAEEILYFMGSKPVLRYQATPTLAQTDEVLDAFVAGRLKTDDANDLLYQVRASENYDPNPGLEKIKAPLLAVSTADDLINPPELGILEKEIKRVPHSRAVLLPLAADTRGHGSHTVAKLWKNELVKLLSDSTGLASQRDGKNR
jgi:homoserine O-acetyltransferase